MLMKGAEIITLKHKYISDADSLSPIGVSFTRVILSFFPLRACCVWKDRYFFFHNSSPNNLNQEASCLDVVIPSHFVAIHSIESWI